MAGLKYMMGRFGYYGGPVRPPLLPLTVAEQDDVEETFKKNNLMPSEFY